MSIPGYIFWTKSPEIFSINEFEIPFEISILGFALGIGLIYVLFTYVLGKKTEQRKSKNSEEESNEKAKPATKKIKWYISVPTVLGSLVLGQVLAIAFGADTFTMIGPITVRYYGLLFAMGFIIGQQIVVNMYKREGRNVREVDSLTLYMVIGTVVGARLGHVFFYEASDYLKDPIQILMIWKGGLASHGAAIGILIATWLYVRKYKVNALWLLDRVVIVVALSGFFIRTGNLMNSEIIGIPTNNSYGFVFIKNAEKQLGGPEFETVEASDLNKDTIVDGQQYVKTKLTYTYHQGKGQDPIEVNNRFNIGLRQDIKGVDVIERHAWVFEGESLTPKTYLDDNKQVVAEVNVWGIPRHPGQLYEGISCLILFALLMVMYYKRKTPLPYGRFFGIFLVYIFSLRILYEFFKENQAKIILEDNEPLLNMGQWLSVPMVLAGIFFLYRSYRKPQVPKTED